MSENDKRLVAILRSDIARIELQEIPSLIADTLHPTSAWTPAKINALHKHTRLVCEAIVSGKLKALKGDRTPVTAVPALHSLQGLCATVSIDDVRKYFNDLDISVQFRDDKIPGENKPSAEASIIGLTKREKNIREIEAAAKLLGYDKMNIPTKGKKEIQNKCSQTASEFAGAWKDARTQNRVRMKDHAKFSRR